MALADMDPIRVLKRAYFQSSVSLNKEHGREETCDSAALSNFVVGYTDISFVTFCCPFRLARSERDQEACRCTGHFTIKSYWPHVILCAVFTFLGVLFQIRNIGAIMPGPSKSPQDHIFFITFEILALTALITLKRWWIDRGSFLRCANFVELRENKFPRVKDTWFTRKIFVLASSFLHIGLSLTEMFNRYDISGKSYSVAWKEMITTGRQMIFLHHRNETENLQLDSFFGAVSIIGIIHRYIMLF